ncbi:MerR family DNA-binding transcriptional regulator [Streptomyces sp. NPDC059695]|uniref:MerR family DNA-binding transcriptional regulator n=1 Tax=Streptomyces sp. NPDC059695 TaxID=3346910 RepID=UPI0036A061BE
MGAAGHGQHGDPRGAHGTTVDLPVRWKVKPYAGRMRIGELASTSALSTRTIRFCEQAGLLPAPPRTPGGYRDYPEHAVSRLSAPGRHRTTPDRAARGPRRTA